MTFSSHDTWIFICSYTLVTRVYVCTSLYIHIPPSITLYVHIYVLACVLGYRYTLTYACISMNTQKSVIEQATGWLVICHCNNSQSHPFEIDSVFLVCRLYICKL